MTHFNIVKHFPTLYKRTSTNKIQLWNISVVESEGVFNIQIKRGQVDGKLIEEKGKSFTEGKNIGRANETTAKEQAIFEAESDYNKKLDEGYVIEATEAETKITVLPMLAQKFYDMEHVVVYPCFTQVKLDGTRCISKNNENNIELISRQGKEFFFLDHIREELKLLFDDMPKNFYFDGELYSEELTFQEIVGCVKKSKKKNVDEKQMLKIGYYIYDCFDLDNLNIEYKNKYELLKRCFKNRQFKYLKLVQTDIANNREEVFAAHHKYVEQGWEGAIIRNQHLIYELDKRSKNLLKLKSFMDEEFKIVGVEQATGMDEGTAIFVCENNGDNRTFNCRPKGTREQRKEWYINRKDMIGKMLTVEFFEKTDDGLPRFPVGKAIRDNY